MTLPIFGSRCAPGIYDSRWLPAPGTVVFSNPTIDLVALFGLDRSSPDRRIICRWYRELDGRIACLWEPDIVPIPQR